MKFLMPGNIFKIAKLVCKLKGVFTLCPHLVLFWVFFRYFFGSFTFEGTNFCDTEKEKNCFPKLSLQMEMEFLQIRVCLIRLAFRTRHLYCLKWRMMCTYLVKIACHLFRLNNRNTFLLHGDWCPASYRAYNLQKKLTDISYLHCNSS